MGCVTGPGSGPVISGSWKEQGEGQEEEGWQVLEELCGKEGM